MGKEFKFIRPIKGLLVRDPLTKAIIPKTGATVPWIGPEGRYWRKRLHDKSIRIVGENSKTRNDEDKGKGGKK